MVSKKHYQAYAVAMQTVAGTRQVVMLYDGVIRFLQLAREAMAEKRIEERFNNLTRASEIIFGLQGCLDFEKGGNIAQILFSFYSSVDLRIFGLHRSNDAQSCDQLIAEIKQMRDVWAEIDSSLPVSGESGASGEPVSEDGSPKGGDKPPTIAISA